MTPLRVVALTLSCCVPIVCSFALAPNGSLSVPVHQLRRFECLIISQQKNACGNQSAAA
jgi:hypothetical protein